MEKYETPQILESGSQIEPKVRDSENIPPNYGFSLRDANMEQKRSVNYDKSKQDLSTYSEESSDDDYGQDKGHYEQKINNKINPINKFKPSRIKAKYRKKRRWNEIKHSDNENNEEQSDNTAHMEKRQLVNYDEPKQDSSTYLDMEESSDDGRQDEKRDDIDDKKYINFS